ncbi:hypothetical protein IC229_17975 [Spirosoma sp. BT702]|uniref:Outer membrane protein beta-barrel domain-containing protein n=1 Tax=Spirosoma profusum TaxID=2771354 RepID=A0A926XYL2_9BACT|nr:hypothetical protein [Spirosoma profusum]MBD2702541.1 hypothetical protein [Spirosoma profusum]
MRTILLIFSWLVPALALGQTAPFKPVFTNMTEIGALFGQVKFGTQGMETVSKRVNLTAQTFNGVLLNPRLAVGATVGVDWYNAALLTPICAGARYDLARPNDKNLRIFASLDTGWGFSWLNEDAAGYKTSGGWVISPGIGFRIGNVSNSNFVMALSYKRQEAEADKPLFSNELAKHETRVYNRIAIRLGVSF